MQWYIFQVKYSSLKRLGQSSPFSLICCYITLEKHWKNPWPPCTVGQKALNGISLVSSSSVFPARRSPGGLGVSPQQLGIVRHLHGGCPASPSGPSCGSTAVCWGSGMFLTQLCSAGRSPMDCKGTADSTVTRTLAADNQKLPPHTLDWTYCPSFDPLLLPLALSNECKQSQLFQSIFSLFFFQQRGYSSFTAHSQICLLKKWTHLVGGLVKGRVHGILSTSQVTWDCNLLTAGGLPLQCLNKTHLLKSRIPHWIHKLDMPRACPLV